MDFALPTETVYAFEAPPLRFGLGATADVGRELVRLGVGRALIVTDARLEATGLPAVVAGHAEDAGVSTATWAGVVTEPTDRSIATAIEELSGERFDGYVGVGGGSVIDSAKAINLSQTHGQELRPFATAPVGDARPIPGRLRPLIGMPTTAGTGAECTSNCVIDFQDVHMKASIADHLIRPSLAIIDPAATLTMPPEVTAASGFDVLVQSVESFTTRPYDRRPRFEGPGDRPVYGGAHPITDACCERALGLVGRFLRRAVHNPDDLEARVGMAQAALFSRLGSAGVHLPHATGYAVASLVRDYRPPAFFPNRPLVPHGQSVAVAAPACFRFTYVAAPERHALAAALLGADGDRGPEALPAVLAGIIADCDGPTSIQALGYGAADVPALAAATVQQTRVLAGSPRTVTEADVAGIFERSLG